ncbi:MAG: tripartite tricarboxylate transporter substrate binding protein [Alphaproteobacteria bacterium]|nr:tripartite tricarboxylate transporter substrate binding protein [Alphaproteobacteria bacterium]
MRTSVALAAAAASVLAVPALADYPERPIQIIVPYSAGGGTDLSVRLLADSLTRQLEGARVVVRNQPGGGGSVGTSAAIHARPDGYTLGTGAQGPLALLPHLGGTDYQLEDVNFIALFGRNLQVLVACANAPFQDFDAFMAHAKDNAVQVGNSGAGGANHISAEAFAKAADVKIESVPYPGSADARTACIGGHIDAMVASPAEALSASGAGQMTPLFVMEDERIDVFPDTPTAAEKGIDFTWSSWKGIIAPEGLPEEVKATLQEAIAAAVEDQEFRTAMEELGEFVVFEDAEAYEARAVADSEVARQTIEDLGLLGMNN